MSEETKPPTSDPAPDEFTARQRSRLTDFAHQVSQTHGRYLANERERMEDASEATRRELAQTLEAAGGQSGGLGTSRPALVTAAQLREFAEGDIFQCLSPAYRVYTGRRTPRIPNRDLLVMSRVTALTGKPGQPDEAASIEAEFDVPQDAWFLRPSATPDTPYSLLLEMALQPCGYLTAHLETPLAFPREDFYFRNLDGQARLLRPVNLRGKTVVNHSRLLKTSLNAGIIIQKFSFELLCDDQPFYNGQSVFGYFPSATMRSQAGLEGGARQDPWIETADLAGLSSIPLSMPVGDRLDDLDEVVAIPGGGVHGQGYIYARKHVDPAAWFFACHFKDDPVMPGSLGIEAAYTALRLFGQTQGENFHPDRYALANDPEVVWKYRGQILPHNALIELEVHLTGLTRSAGSLDLVGNATLWVDRTRIYQVNHVGVRLLE